MIYTFKIRYKGANYQQIKSLDKTFKNARTNHYTGLAGKELCFSFTTSEERKAMVEDFKNSLHNKSNKGYEIYENKAVVFLR